MSEGEQATFACPDCDTVTATQRGLSQHRAKVHGFLSPTSSRQRSHADGSPPAALPTRPPLELSDSEVGELRDRLVGHFATIGAFIIPFVPHTGLTLISRSVDRETEVRQADGTPLKDANGRRVVIRKRGLATILVDYGRRDPRILRGLLAFDRFMSSGDEIEIGACLAAAVAVDTGRVDPHEGIGIPGTPIRLSPDLLIPDVIAEVEEMIAAQQAEAVAQASPEVPDEERARSPDGALVVPGGVEST